MNDTTVITPIPRVPKDITGRYLRFAKGKYAQVYAGLVVKPPLPLADKDKRDKYYLAPNLRPDDDADDGGWSDEDDDKEEDDNDKAKQPWPRARLIAFSKRYRALCVGTATGT